MRAKRPDSGFSLLEIIVVLAIAGIALTFYAAYARKEANRTARENLASAAVQEMKGVMTFVLDSDAEPSLDEGNPLYSNDTLVDDALYHRRLSNKSNDKDTGASSHYFLWGDGDNSAKQQRYAFISEKCASTLKSAYELGKEYLPCRLNSVAKNSTAMIERVGFYAPDESTSQGTSNPDKDDLAINRTDIIVAFKSDTKQDRLGFVDYYPQFSKALTNSGLIVSKSVVVYRSSSTANWQLVMQKNDPTTPVEFVDVVNNIGAVAAYTTGQFGVRFSFNMSDNEQGESGSGSDSGGAGNTCWNSEESKVTLCYDKASGTGSHGEDQILALNMTDTTNARGDQMAGTLKSNLVMENTARPVYIFKREYGGDLVLASDGTPERIVYTDDDGNTFMGDFYLGTRSQSVTWNGHSTTGSNDTLIDYYRTAAFDTYELVTPSTSEYSGYEYDQQDITDNNSYIASYDDGSKTSGSRRFSVQACPKIEQSITLRDAEGNPLTDSDGNKITKKITRELYPQLSASISSVSAYSHTHDGIYLRQDKTRENLDSDEIVGMLGGITVQVELAAQDKKSQSGLHDDMNAAGKMIFPNSKYVWVVTSTMGMYDSESGSGKNIVNPLSISYTITKWCSTVPQMGTPADLLSTTKYESNMDED